MTIETTEKPFGTLVATSFWWDWKHASSESGKRRRAVGTVTYPRFDILETDEELVLYGDLPGVEPADLHIRFENRELTVYGKVSPRHAERWHLYGEYGIGDFYRTFAIGETIDSGKITAELKNGVLSLHLPKTEAVKPKRIAVKAG